jgi:small-conductance mechanosensitive channel
MQLLTDAPVLGNPLQAWLLAGLAAVAAYVVIRMVLWTVRVRLEKLSGHTRSSLDDVLTAALKKTRPLLLVPVAIRVGMLALTLSRAVTNVVGSIAMLAVLLQAGLWISAGLTEWVGVRREQRLEEDAAGVMSMKVLAVTVRIALWSILLLLALDNLGVDVTTLVAGLGVGGVAVALAAQNILGDLFASLSIVLDKPFVLGDFLVVGDFLGAVEDIGLKTTRVRSLSGEQLVFSNADLLKSRIRNYGRMYERRVVFSIGVTYQTPREKLERVPGMIRDAIEAQDHVRFDRAHFKSFGDFSLVFEAVYYVLGPDYNQYMDIRQAINLSIHEQFEEASIEFAYPTQRLLLEPVGGAQKGWRT